MDGANIVFDENAEMYFYVEELGYEVCLAICDDLNAYDEDLADEYKDKICSFVKNISNWYRKSVNAVNERGKNIYGIQAMEQDFQLMKIFILFEQNENPLFGLSFRTEFDIEHGCGLKINCDNYTIVDIGGADVSFS